MKDLVDSLRRFIAQDVVFVLGGSAIILSFCYAFDRLWILDMPRPLYLIAAGFAYVLGYVVHEAACLARLVPAAPFFVPSRWLARIYRAHEHCDWAEVPAFDAEAARLRVERAAAAGDLPEASCVRLERLMALRQVGTALGPCCIVSCGLLVRRSIAFTDPFDIALVAALLLLGGGLIVFGWLKAAQQIELLRRLVT